MDEAAVRYWKKFEDETGEKPGMRCVGQWSAGGAREGLWGILVITDRSLRFRHLASDNWLARLFKPRDAEGAASEPVEIIVPLSSVTEVRTPEKNWWSRIFGAQQLQFEVSWASIEGPRSEVFGADSRQFVEALRKAVASNGN